MKHIADIQPGGFIVDNEYHKAIGEMLQERDAAILALAGDKAIISGVEADGANTTAGVVTFNGKIYRFVAGETAANVITKRIAIDRPNASQIDAPAFYEDVIEFGDTPDTGFDSFPFSDLKRYYVNEPKYKEIKILGRNVTNEELAGTGWFLANGQNGTDNLVDRFFVVAGGDHSVGNTVGSKTVNINAANLPKVTANNIFVGAEGVGRPDGGLDNAPVGRGDSYPRTTKTFKTEDLGANNQPLDITPFSYAVVAIQFIGI
jgi:hypothetical protein